MRTLDGAAADGQAVFAVEAVLHPIPVDAVAAHEREYAQPALIAASTSRKSCFAIGLSLVGAFAPGREGEPRALGEVTCRDSAM